MWFCSTLRNLSRVIGLLTVSSIAATLLTGCGLGTQIASAQPLTVTPGAVIPSVPDTAPATLTPPATPGNTTDVIGPQFAEGMNPLTGLPADDPTLLQRRPVVAKISNAPPLVRPQAGVGQAALMFEHYAEGGLTRFSGVFYGLLPERIGSVRSARLIDHELVPMYDGLLIFSGGSVGVEEIVFNSEYSQQAYKGVLYSRPYYWRDEAIPVPHNLFANARAISDLAVEEGVNSAPTLDGMTFSSSPPPNADGTATTIDIRYEATRVQWQYDPESGLYRRSADGQPHFDATTEQQVTAANVVIIYAGHELSDIVESEFQGAVTYGWRIFLWPTGPAIIFRDGQRYEGIWARSERDHMLTLHTLDNSARLHLKPGNTFFQVVKLPEQMNEAEEWVRWE